MGERVGSEAEGRGPSSECTSEYGGAADLLRRPEGKTLEFKRDLSSPSGVLKMIVAFANTAGGTLLIGVEDATTSVRGLDDPLTEVEERLANLVSDGISPRLLPEVEVVQWRGTHLLAVEVHPSRLRPHHLMREDPDRGPACRRTPRLTHNSISRGWSPCLPTSASPTNSSPRSGGSSLVATAA